MQIKKQEPSLSPLSSAELSRPQQSQVTSSGASWLFWLALPTAFAVALWWSHSQLQTEVKQLREQLLATRDSFVQVSEQADDRLVALSQQLTEMGQLDARSLAAMRSLQELQQLVVSEQQQSGALQQQLATAQGELEGLTSRLQDSQTQQQNQRQQDLEQVQEAFAKLVEDADAQRQALQAHELKNEQASQQQSEQLMLMQELQSSQDAQLDSLRTQLAAIEERLAAGEQSFQQALSRLEQLQTAVLSQAEHADLQQELTAFRAQTLRIQRGLQQRLDSLEQR